MFDDVISTGLQAVLAEIFESVDKNQLNVSLVGDIFKESHLELTDLRLKKTLLKDMNLPVEVKEGLVGKLVIQGLSGEYLVCLERWSYVYRCACCACFLGWSLYVLPCLCFLPSLLACLTTYISNFQNIRSWRYRADLASPRASSRVDTYTQQQRRQQQHKEKQQQLQLQ